MKEEKISCRAHALSVRCSPSRHVCAIRGEGEDVRGGDAEHKEKFGGVWSRQERKRETERKKPRRG